MELFLNVSSLFIFSFSVCRRFITKVGLEGVDVSYLILQPIS
jgi:hypothetical protein